MQPTSALFYVADIAKSTAFYENLFELKPKMASPFFVVFKLDGGFEFCLWVLSKVEPPAPVHGVSSELGFLAADKAALDLTYEVWRKKGIPIIVEPKKMYFGGFNFVGQDPDGHRLRVSTPD